MSIEFHEIQPSSCLSPPGHRVEGVLCTLVKTETLDTEVSQTLIGLQIKLGLPSVHKSGSDDELYIFGLSWYRDFFFKEWTNSVDTGE